MNLDHSAAAEFEDEDVVSAYAHRPSYPPALLGHLLRLAPERGQALDLGCGPGKLARALAPHFELVTGVDPSAAMLRVAQASDWHGDVRWVQARAEDLRLESPLHLVVAGASIHWMDPGAVFPALFGWLAPNAPIAIVNGDEPAAAPWIETYRTTIRAWVGRMGGRWDSPARRARAVAHEAWIDIRGREVIVHEVRQRLEDMIEAEHSRPAFTRRRMGALAEVFDDDLRAVLSPWARDGVVIYGVHTRLDWGFVRPSPLQAE
jgi:SAM-dependent methyltransferase